ncbi:MAG TPA: VOC family protein [Burkholderiales bacterium]|nr:VOC family protein [Burkholderiales bacterium]
MSEPGFRLDHLNLPARDPEGLARWYARTFGLQADGHRVRGPGLLIAFQAGEPVRRAPELHIGFRVADMNSLNQWARKFGAQVMTGSEFASFRTFDPEDNCVEIYCKADS